MNDVHRIGSCPHSELAVGWALHALEPAEESLVAAHLPGCETCSGTAAEAENVAAMLGLCIPEATPRASLEQLVLSAAGDSWEVPAVPRAPTRRITKPSWLRTGELVAAAAVILVAATAFLGVRVTQLSGQLNEAQHQVTGMSKAIQSAADPAAVRVPLVAKDGHAVGMVLANRAQVAVVATQLPSNENDQTYVLWGLSGGSPVALTAFDVARDAPGPHSVPAASAPGQFTGYAVSLEPGRRAPATPTDIVASGQVAG
ncbi:MAG: anti-sigma factor [Pseudonocardiaceae bacterium]